MSIKELFHENKKSITFIGALLIILLLIKILSLVGNNNNLVKNYIEYKGFTLDKDNILYQKQLSTKDYDEYLEDVDNKINSEYNVLYFDTNTYQLSENLYEYTDGISSLLSALYDYKENELTYIYRVTYESANIIFKGSYDLSTFTCENDFSYDAYTDDKKEYFCDKVENNIKKFKNISKETISSTKVLNYMREH